jgi:hypothetical protein
MLNKNLKVMKTRIFTLSLMLMAVVLFSCKKDKEESASQQEVSFQANQIIPEGGLKSTADFDIECSTTEPSNAHIVIEGVVYDPSVYRVDGVLYTQAIKLTPGDYTVTQFFLYKDLGTPGYDAADLIVMATPETGSPYAAYTTPDLPYDFTVSAFAKTQVSTQVLCFEPEAYSDFGFGWFTIGEVILREACFFGDICIANPALYAGSIYAANGVNVDEVAVTQVIVKRNDVEVPNSPFNNVATYGAAAPLCVQYPDYVGQLDNFTFELQVWVPSTVAGTFAWQTYATLTTTDAVAIPGTGAQGVFDYAIGTCSPNSTNIYQWLAAPPTPPQTSNWAPFYIRNNAGTIAAPWDTDMNVTENAAGDGFSAATPRSGQKVGYGTNQFDGVKVNSINSLNYQTITLPAPGVRAYINMWVTDGSHYAIISSENEYLGTNFLTRQEWKVFETDFTNLNWLFESGTGARDGGQYLTRNGIKVSLADFGNNIVLVDPGTYPSPPVGTGAPRAGYGLQLIFGDTQANFTNGSFSMDQLNITVNNVIYTATN